MLISFWCVLPQCVAPAPLAAAEPKKVLVLLRIARLASTLLSSLVGCPCSAHLSNSSASMTSTILPAYINANMEVRRSCHDACCCRSRDLEGTHEHDGIWKRPRVEKRAHPNHSTKLWAVFVCLLFSNLINLLGGIDGKQGILRVYDTILHRECAEQREGTNSLSHSGPSARICDKLVDVPAATQRAKTPWSWQHLNHKYEARTDLRHSNPGSRRPISLSPSTQQPWAR